MILENAMPSKTHVNLLDLKAHLYIKPTILKRNSELNFELI